MWHFLPKPLRKAHRDGLEARFVSRLHLKPSFAISTGPVYDRKVMARLESILERLAFFNSLSLSGAGVQRDTEARLLRLLKSQLKLSLCGGTFASRTELFLSTSVYFCRRAGCPTPRFLTTNRTLEGPTGFLRAFRHLFAFHLASLPQPQKGTFGAPSLRL